MIEKDVIALVQSTMAMLELAHNNLSMVLGMYEREGFICPHSRYIELTTMGATERTFRCEDCGYMWTEPFDEVKEK